MTWLAAVATGFGLGIASFGALWVEVRELARRRRWGTRVGAGNLVRLFVVGLVLYALGREGPDVLLAALAGLWLARGCLIGGLGGVRHGR